MRYKFDTVFYRKRAPPMCSYPIWMWICPWKWGKGSLARESRQPLPVIVLFWSHKQEQSLEFISSSVFKGQSWWCSGDKSWCWGINSGLYCTICRHPLTTGKEYKPPRRNEVASTSIIMWAYIYIRNNTTLIHALHSI